MSGTAHIIRGDALALPLPDASVDLVVTSPPYFALRSYQDGGEHYAGQLGSEATPAAFVDALIAATAEMVRVLKPSGSIWVNLGDKYAGNGGGGVGSSDGKLGRAARPPRDRVEGILPKSLIGIPWRYAIRCIDDLGLILRAEVIWEKGNGLPESVRDRVRRSHETWFHFTKQPRYYSAVDTIRECIGENGLGPRSTSSRTGAGNGWVGAQVPATASSGSTARPCSLTELPTSCGWDPSPAACILTTCAATASVATLHTLSPSPCKRTCSEALSLSRPETPPRRTAETDTNTTRQTPSSSRLTEAECVECARASATENGIGPSESLGKLPGSVWRVNTEPLTVPDHLGVDHFAAFPSEWPRRIIAGWSPSGICVECGEGRRPMTDKAAGGRMEDPADWSETVMFHDRGNGGIHKTPFQRGVTTTITGYACACARCVDVTKNPNGWMRCPLPMGHEGMHAVDFDDPGSHPEITPAVILDPFGGTGTTALVAKALGRHGISVDMSADYCRLAQWRTNDPDQVAKAMRVDKPPRQIDGQAAFEFEDTA